MHAHFRSGACISGLLCARYRSRSCDLGAHAQIGPARRSAVETSRDTPRDRSARWRQPINGQPVAVRAVPVTRSACAMGHGNLQRPVVGCSPSVLDVGRQDVVGEVALAGAKPGEVLNPGGLSTRPRVICVAAANLLRSEDAMCEPRLHKEVTAVGSSHAASRSPVEPSHPTFSISFIDRLSPFRCLSVGERYEATDDRAVENMGGLTDDWRGSSVVKHQEAGRFDQR
jgi:hypothetical protein